MTVSELIRRALRHYLESA
ncbi:MAG: ribbon-helix-helix protein, CopG family [Acidimicrobiales bacterium]